MTLKTKTQFKEAISYLKESSRYIYVALYIFIAGTIIGLVFRDNLTFIDEILKQLISKTIDLNTPEMVFFLLQNNLQSAILSVFFGIVLGILPLFSSLSNGVILGYVMGRTIEVSSVLSLWRLFPHGIFELPAIFISFGLGIKWGKETLSQFFSIHKKDKTKIRIGILTILLLLLSPIIASILTQLESTNVISLFISLIFIISLVSFLSLFVFNKKIRAFQKKILYQISNTFLMIIIPLLIIAAIIEGILIGLF